MLPAETQNGFAKPVESIMRCEDFKSNFARKLSHRYISRSPADQKPDSKLKLRPADCEVDTAVDVSTKDVPVTQTVACPSVDSGRPPDKTAEQRKNEMKSTEVAALSMDVDTLKWQLAQTEASRQMHLALLKQIVTFLNRVKDHMEAPKAEVPKNMTSRASPRSFTSADLPRSRSVVHMCKSQEYSLSSPRKMSARKISKSIANVNGFKEISDMWNQSKLSLVQEADPAPKIIEEIKRLITLANTVISTKIPDLNCNNHVVQELPNIDCYSYAKDKCNGSTDMKEIDSTKNSLNDSNSILNNSNVSLTSNCNREEANMENKISNEVDMCVEGSKTFGAADTKSFVNHFDQASHYIEDESGFSSMSSFQEIGIPIINIIPPTPCKDIILSDRLMDTIDESAKWKSESLELDKQAVKVFWV